MMLLLRLLLATPTPALASAAADVPLYRDAAAPVNQRVQDLLGRMTCVLLPLLTLSADPAAAAAAAGWRRRWRRR